jgi:hypothetical protein
MSDRIMDRIMTTCLVVAMVAATSLLVELAIGTIVLMLTS